MPSIHRKCLHFTRRFASSSWFINHSTKSHAKATAKVATTNTASAA